MLGYFIVRLRIDGETGFYLLLVSFFDFKVISRGFIGRRLSVYEKRERVMCFGDF